MSHLINIFLEPAKVFADLKEKPGFWLPLLLLAVLGVVSTTAYFLTVDPEWFSGHQVAQMQAQRDMSAAEVEQAKQFMPGARASAYFAGPMVVLFMGLVFAVMALYYLLAGKVTGNAVGFRRGLALVAWSSMPMVLGNLVVLGALFTSSNQVSFESLQLLNVDPLFVQLPLDHDWLMLARSFSLLNFWVWFLAALGWKTWFRTGWGQAVTVAVLPSVVIYGVMALFAAL
ncbi:YIP1 family protein [bacterium BD-1]|uniref:YIP1 family protein n=1 Tax=Arenimonas sp. TaxID=1872635 RepID=UPI001E37614F|nr:YIP1 family protein [Ottowia caeni]